MPAPLSPSPAIRAAEVDGVRVILDLRSESYHVLEGAADAMWDALAEAGSVEAALPALERRFRVDRERLRADLEAFAERCVERGFIERAGGGLTGGTPTAPRAPVAARRPSTRLALRSLFATRRELGRTGLVGAYAACAGSPPAEPEAGPEIRDRALGAFVRAENLFLARRAPDDCLLRSLSLYRFLLAVGVGAEHRIGVRRFPFGAHAWVEHGDEVLLDDPFHIPAFTVLARLPDRPDTSAALYR